MKPRLLRFWVLGLVLPALYLGLSGIENAYSASTTTSSFDPSSDAPVTQRQFKAWTDWSKKAVEILDTRSKKLQDQQGNPSSQSSEQSVNLLNMPKGSSQATLGGSGGPSGGGPKLTTYFDLNFINQPGTQDSLAFDNYHTFLFFDIAPTPDITFSFNLLGPSTFPIFYELDYQASKALTLRAGKIWIPFDDLSSQTPHNIFGGRVGIQRLEPSSTGINGDILLPEIWTELGVGAKLMLVDTQALALETHLCIVNGFTDGGTDPLNPNAVPQIPFPKFDENSPNTQSSSGNHRAKSVAARAHALFFNQLGLGVSYYGGQWNQDTDPAGSKNLSMVGLDAQARFSGLELRAGLASMTVNLDTGGNTKRGGTYGEVGVPFAKSKWKILARMGTLNLDSRVELPTDQTLIGGTILYRPTPMVQFSLENSHDVKDPGVAVDNKSFTDLRMVMMF